MSKNSTTRGPPVPLKARCPSCGEPVTDNIMLVGYHRRGCPIASFHWSEGMVRKFFKEKADE